jgi:hypothetical protein
VYCSLDKIDLAATVDGTAVAIQTDHRSPAEIEAEPELSVLFAMTRVINARSEASQVHYVVGEPPPLLAEALSAVGAVISDAATHLAARDVPAASEELAGELADRAFRELAHRVAAQVGTRDLAMALRMLEDQTLAAPPERGTPAYWKRVLELAALTGELLRVKSHAWGTGRWVQTDRALVPFGFELTTGGGTTVMFPTNRAQRVIEDGSDESLFKLLVAVDETLQRPPDAATGRLMPSLRDRRNVELEEIVWKALLPDSRAELPVVVCGIDGESTFGMIRREALGRTSDEALDEALRNLADEQIEIGELQINDVDVIAITNSFYAAEKILDRELMRKVHDHLDHDTLYAAVPSRGVLLITNAEDPVDRARFAAVVRARYDEAGGRAISPVVLVLEDGRVVGFLRDTVQHRADTAPVRAETTPDLPPGPEDHDPPRRRGLLRRLLGRK